MAAMSASAAASARWPASAAVHVRPSEKCVPSTMTSTDVHCTPSARTTAASSPIQRSTRDPGGRRTMPRIASISSSSAMAVDDARAAEVVGGDLHADAIARQDADAVAPHLSCDMPEDLVAVVELHAEHRVGQRLDNLALELDLLFLRQAAVLLNMRTS